MKGGCYIPIGYNLKKSLEKIIFPVEKGAYCVDKVKVGWYNIVQWTGEVMLDTMNMANLITDEKLASAEMLDGGTVCFSISQINYFCKQG